jgi:uncharacterized protein YbaR (Trm112 family)
MQLMAVDPELLSILACPACESRPPVTLCKLKESVAKEVADKYRERIKDEEPVVTEGLSCAACGRVYAIVSDIPVMLIEEALPADARVA